MPMMPPDADLKTHLENRRSLAEARATYFAPFTPAEPALNNLHDFSKLREEIAALRNGTPAR